VSFNLSSPIPFGKESVPLILKLTNLEGKQNYTDNVELKSKAKAEEKAEPTISRRAF
jgi:hypothetical protein